LLIVGARKDSFSCFLDFLKDLRFKNSVGFASTSAQGHPVARGEKSERVNVSTLFLNDVSFYFLHQNNRTINRNINEIYVGSTNQEEYQEDNLLQTSFKR
jgi:hypothetical protein